VDPVLAAVDPPLIVACRYEGCVPEAIVGYKDRGISSLRPLLGHVLAAGVLEAVDLLGPSPPITLVPAATSSAAVRRRGFDHMWDVARTASVATDLPALRLLRAGTRADQAGLSFAARRRNLRSTMRATRTGDGPVIVVDDVRTSGATLAECDRALTEGGYEVVAHVVIAGSIIDPTRTQCG
jgi:predicted amidophosphoribosyltransferase